ncbi:GNAT family N-acetyltransferase [Streptococcus plurextorum]|uniref:GNAT family N-acetyltransferase n=1 Tax=Streptococcus plurextorum TaxID=456876 RepID=UPI0003FDE9E9|nr:GNAT family N-acetyltransferase [Streptococcus plurextorum]
MITATNTLNAQQLAAVKDLIKTVQTHDGTYRTPYLSNMLNFDPEMPAFFLAYQGEQLVGLLTVYADDEDVELAILVHPDHRRQGLARKLYACYQAETANYPIASETFQTERVFLVKHPDLATAWSLVENTDTETWMGREREPYQFSQQAELTVSLAQAHHADDIARFQAQVFDSDYQVALRYAREAIADTDSLLYLLENSGAVIGSCTVDISTDVNYLYGLAIAPDHQQKGYGTYLVKSVVNDLIRKNDKPFQIAVEDDNHVAKRLYENIGFTKQTQVVYLDSKGGPHATR